MTAIRNFPNAPLRQRPAAPWRWQIPGWLLTAWHAMERFGYRRAAFELDLQARHHAVGNPDMARQFAAAAAECRRAATPAAPRSAS